MKSSIAARKMSALTALQNQLTSGTRPVNKKDYVNTDLGNGNIHYGKPVQRDEKGNIVWDKKKDGTQKPILLDRVPLTDSQRTQKEKEVASLKTKLKLN